MFRLVLSHHQDVQDCTSRKCTTCTYYYKPNSQFCHVYYMRRFLVLEVLREHQSHMVTFHLCSGISSCVQCELKCVKIVRHLSYS
jgi:hypothetical protein